MHSIAIFISTTQEVLVLRYSCTWRRSENEMPCAWCWGKFCWTMFHCWMKNVRLLNIAMHIYIVMKLYTITISNYVVKNFQHALSYKNCISKHVFYCWESVVGKCRVWCFQLELNCDKHHEWSLTVTHPNMHYGLATEAFSALHK